ncbi:MAG: mandelate racemase, partial [Actinobacteria bacterium]|nr:mandelate racemase [Actinomycetota bacterium]
MSAAGRITDIRATTVTVPLEAPILHANGAHWGRFVRTIVEIETDTGLVGLGEMGGGGESAEQSIRAMNQYLAGHDPFQLEALRWKIMNPTASLYNARMQIHAALEFACIDIIGQALGIRACDLLGGALRERVPFASYLFYRLANDETGGGGEQTIDAMVGHAKQLVERHGFRTHKLKGGYFPPAYDIAVYKALAEAFPDDRFRLDPNAIWSVEESIAVAQE